MVNLRPSQTIHFVHCGDIELLCLTLSSLMTLYFFLTDSDECQGSPCVNAVSCKNLVGDYRCQCMEGWTGKNCDQTISNCGSQCHNGGTCIDLAKDYRCICQSGYTGQYSSNWTEPPPVPVPATGPRHATRTARFGRLSADQGAAPMQRLI